MSRPFRTRKQKLKNKIIRELYQAQPDINNILLYVDEYEKNNLITINKLNRKKVVTLRKINGALKQTIDAHGAITMQFVSSATKRIYGSVMEKDTLEEDNSFIKRILKWVRN